MPCQDSSSSMSIRLDNHGRLVRFDYAKITCGREITGDTQYSQHCQGKTLEQILKLSYSDVVRILNVQQEEKQFILYLEWEAVRSAIAHYLGMKDDDIDSERCRISSIEYDNDGVIINEVILPPKGLPKILPCRLAN